MSANNRQFSLALESYLELKTDALRLDPPRFLLRQPSTQSWLRLVRSRAKPCSSALLPMDCLCC
jgi:hypothetical protein